MSYTKEQVIALADQFTCHPASRSIDEIEMAGEMLKDLLLQREAFKDAAAFHKSRADDAEKQRDELLAACEKTISENGHLADGDVCTLIDFKRAIASVKANIGMKGQQ